MKSPTGAGPRPQNAVVSSYVALTKPRIIELLLITTIPVMFLAAGGVPPVRLVVDTVVGGTLAAASANVLNCYLDRDIDALMRRTSNRPLVTGAVSVRGALVFGTILGILATLLLGLTVNWLSAFLALAANAYYVLGYTLWLKRRTPSNIVWGGAAGCMPVLIGWTAVTGQLSWAPVVLFAVVFLWTPAHFWALATRFRQDYQNAHVPMLPVAANQHNVQRRILQYTWLTVAAAMLLWPVADTTIFYPLASLVLGFGLLGEAYRLRATGRANERPAGSGSMRFFHCTNAYLALLFVSVAIDSLLAAS